MAEFNKSRQQQYNPLKCEICDKKFKINITIHNGQKDQCCNSCGKVFSEAGNLKSHINSVHNGQKDHKCHSCGKSFSEAGNLKNHQFSS